MYSIQLIVYNNIHVEVMWIPYQLNESIITLLYLIDYVVYSNKLGRLFFFLLLLMLQFQVSIWNTDNNNKKYRLYILEVLFY